MFYQSTIREAMQSLDCSADFLCAVCEFSSTRLSKFLRGTAELTAPELLKITDTIRELKDLQADCEPIPVRFKNAAVIKQLLSYRREGLRVVAFGKGVIDPHERASQ